MTTRKLRDVKESLKRKGFRQREGDHFYFVYHRISDEKKTAVFTKASHGAVEIDAFLIGQMAKQCRLGRPEFLELLDCPLDRAGYERRLRDKGVVL